MTAFITILIAAPKPIFLKPGKAVEFMDCGTRWRVAISKNSNGYGTLSVTTIRSKRASTLPLDKGCYGATCWAFIRRGAPSGVALMTQEDMARLYVVANGAKGPTILTKVWAKNVRAVGSTFPPRVVESWSGFQFQNWNVGELPKGARDNSTIVRTWQYRKGAYRPGEWVVLQPSPVSPPRG